MWEWDEAKRAANLAKHGADFAEVEQFDWDTASYAVNRRRAYGELRVVSVGWIADRLHVVTWTKRGERTRIINLRKANEREQKDYRGTRAPH